MQQYYLTNFCKFPTTIKPFFARCFAVDFRKKKKTVHKDRKTMCLKGWQQPPLPFAFVFIEEGGPNRDKKSRAAFVGSMSVVIESKFHHYSLRVWVKNRLFLQRTEDDELPQQKSRQIMMSADSLMSILDYNTDNSKVVKIHTHHFLGTFACKPRLFSTTQCLHHRIFEWSLSGLC